jgi:hypothetical protein
MKQTKVFIVLCGLTLILLVGLAVLRKAEIMNMTNVKYANILTFLRIWTPLIGILFVATGAIFISKTVKKT